MPAIGGAVLKEHSPSDAAALNRATENCATVPALPAFIECRRVDAGELAPPTAASRSRCGTRLQTAFKGIAMIPVEHRPDEIASWR